MSPQHINQYRRTRIPGFINLARYQQELITNGTFDSGVSGWTATSPATIAWSAGTMLVSRVNAGIDVDMCYQDVYVIPNHYYLFLITCTAQDFDGRVDFGWDGAAEAEVVSMLTAASYIYWFKATGTVLRIVIKPTAQLSATLNVDNISLKNIIGLAGT